MVTVRVFLYPIEDVFVVSEFEELLRRMEMTLDDASRSRKRKYSPRNRLRRDMVTGNPIFELFVSGSNTGSDKTFHCMLCQRDVSMESRGAAEFTRHFFGKRHWQLDVAYRVRNNMPIYNGLMDPMVPNESQLAEYREWPSKGKSEDLASLRTYYRHVPRSIRVCH